MEHVTGENTNILNKAASLCMAKTEMLQVFASYTKIYSYFTLLQTGYRLQEDQPYIVLTRFNKSSAISAN